MRPRLFAGAASCLAWVSLVCSATGVGVGFGVGTAGCSYDPQIKDGQLQCSTSGECPTGTHCVNNTCFSGSANGSGGRSAGSGGRVGTGGAPGTGGRVGTGGTGGNSSTQDGGLGGDAIPPGAAARFIGNWTLSPTSSVNTTCDDGFMGTTLLSPVANPSVMRITAGVAGQSDLESAWLCPLSLRLDAVGAHLFDANPSCTGMAGSNPLQTWTATSFDIVQNNGATAMHAATYTRVDRYTNGSVVTCSQTVSAQLIKN